MADDALCHRIASECNALGLLSHVRVLTTGHGSVAKCKLGESEFVVKVVPKGACRVLVPALEEKASDDKTNLEEYLDDLVTLTLSYQHHTADVPAPVAPTVGDASHKYGGTLRGSSTAAAETISKTMPSPNHAPPFWSMAFQPLPGSSTKMCTSVPHPDTYEYGDLPSVGWISSKALDHEDPRLHPFLTTIYQCHATSVRNEKLKESIAQVLNPRHTNILPLHAVVSGSQDWYFISKNHSYSLSTLLHFNRDLLDKSEEVKKFLIFQLLHVLSFCHSRGLTLGNICPKSLLITDELWLYLSCLDPVPRPLDILNPAETAMSRWVRGDMSNFDYLIELNRLAGRDAKVENPHYHPVLPWIIDFTSAKGGWRDLTKTKFRLKKGDAQLDEQFYNSHSNAPPHHITETLSEITFYVYLARKSSLDVLKRVVRHKFIPEEYPPSMERIYNWTPDECIPEFFCDSSVFASRHKDLGLDDLQVPDWCSSPSDFIQKHRAALESDTVSKDLHHWIDLTFGYKLSGEAAVIAKNVPLLSSSVRNVATSAIAQGEDAPPWVNHQLHNHGIVQLFTRPHVSRQFSQKRNSAPQVKRWSAKEDPTLPHPVEDEVVETPAPAVIHLPAEPLDLSRAPTASASVTATVTNDVPKEKELPKVALSHDIPTTTVGGNINPCLDPVRGYERVGAFDFSYINLEPVYQPLSPKRVTRQYVDSDDEGEGEAPVTPLPTDVARMGDVFTAGCLIAEIYQCTPLFDLHALQTYFAGSTSPNLERMAAPVRKLVSEMIAVVPSRRPSLQKILNSELFSSQADTGGVVMFRPYHLLHRFLHELQLRQHDVDATAPDPRNAEVKTEETLHNWKAQALLKWVITELPALSCLPVKIYLLTVPFCLKLCFQPVTLVPAVGLFDIFGEKLGKSLSDEHLGSVVEKLLEKHEGSALQVHLFSTTFMQLVQRRFTHRYFLTTYLPHLRNSLCSNIPAVAQAGLAALVEFGSEGLRKQLFEEVVVLHIVVPMLARLGKPGSQHALTLLIRIAKNCGYHLAVNLFLPNALGLIERVNVKRAGRENRETDLTILAALSLLGTILPDLRLSTYESLLLDSQVLSNLLVRPQCGPLPFVTLRALLQVYDQLLKEILPTLLPKKRKKPDASALNTVCASVAQFITSLVQHLRQPDLASLPYDDSSTRDLLCLIYRSVKEALPVEILLQNFLYIDSLDALLREHGDKTRTVNDPCVVYSELAKTNNQQQISPGPVKLLGSKSDVSVEMEGRESDNDSEDEAPKRIDKPAYKGFEENESEALAKMLSAQEDAKKKEKEKKKGFFSSLFSTEKEPRPEGSTNDMKALENEDITPDSPTLGARSNDMSLSGFSLARPANQSTSFPVDFSELSQLDPQQDVAQTWKFKATIRGTFRAHAAAISSMDAHPDRGIFVTASRDTTVKLWTLGLGSNMVHNPLTYRGHRHPVFDVRILSHFSERPVYVASCDHCIHIWDLETGIAVVPPSPNASSLDAYYPVVLPSSFLNDIIARRQMQHFTPHLLRPFLVQHPFVSPYYSETFASALPDTVKPRSVHESPRAAVDVGFYAPDDDLDSAASFSSPPTPSPHATATETDKTTGPAYFSLAPPMTNRHSDGIVCFESVPERNSLVLGTRQASLRFLDLRVGKMSRPWRHTASSQPTAVKSLAVCSSGNWVASGLASGDVNVIELRCGTMLHQWKAHESPIVKLVAYSENYLLSSAADRTMCLWHFRSKGSPIMVKKYVGLTDSVKSLGLHKSDFICGVGHKLGISSLLRVRGEGPTKVSLVALKGYKSRNSLTALSIMSNYSLLLMGTEDGKLLVSV